MADKHQYGFENGVTITPEEAWQVYAGMEKPTYIGCATLLAEQGHKVSYQTLHKWGKRFGWSHRMAMARSTQTLDPASKDVFSILKLKAEWMDPVTLRGLQASVAERMVVEIAQLPIATTEDIERMVDVLDKFDAIIHGHRGAAIGANGEARSPISLEAFRAYQQDKKGSDPTSAPGLPASDNAQTGSGPGRIARRGRLRHGLGNVTPHDPEKSAIAARRSDSRPVRAAPGQPPG